MRVSAGPDGAWVSDPEGATVVGIDPRRNRPPGWFEAVVGDLTVAADGVV